MSDDGSGSACRYNSHFWSCRSFFAHLRNLARTTLEARAIEVANEMVGLSAVAIAETKRAVYEGSEVHMQGGLEIEGCSFILTRARQSAGRPLDIL